jgi:post-segregation antitoxin (ccd killing protein)
MARISRGNEIYVRTGIELPETLREQAREYGISLAPTLIEALQRKIKKLEEERS